MGGGRLKRTMEGKGAYVILLTIMNLKKILNESFKKFSENFKDLTENIKDMEKNTENISS